jgi:hypothetical protein
MSARLVYAQGLKTIQDAGLSEKVVKLTQSTLRLENQLTNSRTQYLFAVLVNAVNNSSNQVFNTEIRLNQQDSFIVSSIRLTIGEPSSATDTTFVDYTYPSPVVFSTSGEAAALETLYKGFLKMTINNVVVMPSLHTGRFRFVPFAQKATAAANQNGIGDDSIDSSTDGISITEPNVILIGSKNNIIEIDLPAAIATVGSNTRVSLEFRGLLAQNSTIIT